MEDIFQVLIIIGFIAFAIFRQLSKKPTAEEKQNMPHYPEYNEEMDDETMITPPFLTTELKSVSKTQPKKTFSTPKTKIKEQTVSDKTEDETLSAEDFNISSMEEVRKAVIWSEILNRKY